MRISHEAIYQSLYIQGRGALRRDLTACLRSGRALRVPLAGHGAEAVRKTIGHSMKRLPEQLRQSLTWDQGAEMAQHVNLRIDTGLEIYFCDPKSPWQRGSNENTNGLLRQYFPKGTDLSRHSARELDAVAHVMNTRPRKTLKWKAPAEVLDRFIAGQYDAGVATTG